MTVSRRTLAKGAAWAAPVIAASTLAPALAASPCASYKRGQPLPASAFTTTYIRFFSDAFGGSANRQIGIEFGFRISDEAQACGVVSGTITSSKNQSYIRLANNVTYTMTSSAVLIANGSVGTVDTSCRGTTSNACGTSEFRPYVLQSSSDTRGILPTRVSIYRSITVTGYGTTAVYLNASSFPAAAGGIPYDGATLSVTSAPLAVA